MRVTYLANSRLPTENAHGLQICKMCESLAGNGAEVRLLHPHTRQTEQLQGYDVFGYYGIPRIFEVERLANADFRPFERLLPRLAVRLLAASQALLWARHAVAVATSRPSDLCYTRDLEIAYWLARRSIPTFLEVHSIPDGLRRQLLHLLARNNVTIVVALTVFIKNRLIQIGFPAQRVLVLGSAVDLRPFRNLPDKSVCRSRLGLPLERPIVGYVGRFEAVGIEKGMAVLVEAAAGLSRSFRTKPLLLCVGGPMRLVKGYRQIARRAGLAEDDLRFVDCVPHQQVPFWLKACDVLTIPLPWNQYSAYYTSPLKLFEYMASAVPIVASDLPSLRHVLRHEENALLVEPGSPIALTYGIGQLLQDTALGGRLAAKATVQVQHLTWDNRARMILQLFEKSQDPVQ